MGGESVRSGEGGRVGGGAVREEVGCERGGRAIEHPPYLNIQILRRLHC